MRDSLSFGPSNFQDRGSETFATSSALTRFAGVDAESTFQMVVRISDPPASAEARSSVESKIRVVRSVYPRATFVTWYNTHSSVLVSRDRRLIAVIVAFKGANGKDARLLARRVVGKFENDGSVLLGGHAVARDQFEKTTANDLRTAEAIALPLLLLLLLYFFRSVVAAAVPLAAGCVAAVLGCAALRFATNFAELSIFAMSFATGLSLGLGVDYSLLMVTRFREEITSGRDRYEAIRVTMRTAGRTVVVSASTIGIALSSLLLFPQPYLYSMGLTGIFVALAAGVVAVTMVPACLLLLGPRIDGLSIRRVQTGSSGSRARRQLTAQVLKRPATLALASGAVLIALCLPALSANFVLPDDRALPHDSSAHRVVDAVDRRFTAHAMTPIYIVVKRPSASLKSVRKRLNETEGKFVVIDRPGVPLVPLYAQVSSLPGVAKMTPFVRREGMAVATVIPRFDPKSAATQRLVGDIRSVEVPGVARPVLVGGSTAALVDLKESFKDLLPVVAALVATTLMLGMFVLTRSVVLALKTIVMGALSFAATIGLLTVAFQDGVLGRTLGFETEPAIGANETVLLLVLVFALTCDYAT
ncbi:MAG: MMPL family transporter, partial [Solirubrobacterales bacterium]